MIPSVAFPLLFASCSSFSPVGTPRTHPKHALPAALHIHTQTVTPTTAFASTPSTADLTQPLRWNSSAGDACGVRRTRERDDDEPEYVQPSFLCWLSRCAPTLLPRRTRMRSGLRATHEYPSRADLVEFMTQYHPDAEAATLTAVPISRNVDGRNHLSLGTNLNTHYIGAMAYPTPITYYYSSSSGSGEVSPGREPGPHDSTGYLEWLDYVLDQSSVQTVSLGYGTQETNIPLEYGWV